MSNIRCQFGLRCISLAPPPRSSVLGGTPFPTLCMCEKRDGWLAGCIRFVCYTGFVWLHADSFLHSVTSPFHSFVTIFLHSMCPGLLCCSLWDAVVF